MFTFSLYKGQIDLKLSVKGALFAFTAAILKQQHPSEGFRYT